MFRNGKDDIVRQQVGEVDPRLALDLRVQLGIEFPRLFPLDRSALNGSLAMGYPVAELSHQVLRAVRSREEGRVFQRGLDLGSGECEEFRRGQDLGSSEVGL